MTAADDCLLLYMAKTGWFVALPPHVVEHLKAVENSNSCHVFWSGTTFKELAVRGVVEGVEAGEMRVESLAAIVGAAIELT